MEENLKETSLNKLNQLVEQRVDLQFDKDDLKAQESEINKKIGEIDDSINQILKAADLQKFSHPRGTISLETKQSVKVPQNPEAKEKFFHWLRDEGLYDQYVTVNSQSVNSLFKTYRANFLAEAEASGKPEDLAKALNFCPPGIEPPSPYERVKLSGKKKE